jgi:predicted ribonuclease YlaK
MAIIQANEDINAAEIYLVIDTNVLISHLLVLKQALARINTALSRLNVLMLVPGIVVSELDYQKNSAKGVANESRRASSWLASEIGNGSSRVRGQAYTQTMLSSGDWRQRSGVGTTLNLIVHPRLIQENVV